MYEAASPTESDLTIENRTDHVLVTGSGLWDVDLVDSHFSRLDRLLQDVRSVSGGARVLVDVSGLPVQPQEAAARIAGWTARIYRAEDRVAIVVSSSLAKVQMRRVAMIACRELFLSRNAALMWLLPHSMAA